ncbi:MAG: penicillin acylase family protein [Thermodesulfobacteriota bacterium]
MTPNRTSNWMDIDPAWLMRIFTVIPVVVILLAGGGALWLYFFVHSLLPEGESEVIAPELRADVRVMRDINGIPGIIGENEEDLAFVLGYVMAQDRLWQMDYLRRASQGRLAEILGPAYLDDDQLMRMLQPGAQSEETPARLGKSEQAWLHSFVKGVNCFITNHANKLPVEFSLLEYRPEPFTPQDVLRLFLALAWETSPSGKVDPAMTKILGRLGKDRALEFFPRDPSIGPPLVSPDLESWEPSGILFTTPSGRAQMMRVPGLRSGCAWAVGGARTRSGKPMTGYALYQVLSAPGFWYRARLATPEFHLAGAFVPGLPVALVGSNGRLAWGCVSAPADDADLYIERLDSDEPRRFWRVDRWRELRPRQETYRVKGKRPVVRTVLSTETGPLVSDPFKEKALSLRWTGQQGLGLFSAMYALNRAGNGDEARAALKALIAPCMNVLWADENGSFGAQLAGRMPVRPPESDGIVPMPAWTGVQDWRGFIPFEALPSLKNPPGDTVAVADDRPRGNLASMFTGCYWSDDSRLARVTELLAKTPEHYKETFQEIQGDTLSPLASQLTPVMLKAIRESKEQDSTFRAAVEALQSWDFKMNADSSPAAVFGLWYQALTEELFLKPLGKAAFEGYAQYPLLPTAVLKRILAADGNKAAQENSSQQVIRKSFQQALTRGKSLMGDDPKKWKWSDIHTTVFYHPLTARSRFLELLYHVGPLGTPGSGDSIDCAGWSQVHPFHVVEGVSLRQISDMTQPPQLFGSAAMGMSAHFFSKHYKDQTRAWLTARTFREPILVTDVRKQGFNPVLFKRGVPQRLSRE